MDDDTRKAFADMNERLNDLMARMNDQHERLINVITGLREDFTNTRDFLLRDAAGRGRQWLDLEERVTRLERGEKP